MGPAAVTTTLSTTRDLVRFRKITSPSISAISSAFLTLLASPTPSASTVRAAFLPALLGSSTPPTDAASKTSADELLRNMFLEPPAIVITQGLVSGDQINSAWIRDDGKGMRESVFIGFALHQELENARNDGEKEDEANLSMMVLATLAFELGCWIFIKSNGHRSLDAVSLYTTETNLSVTSLQSMNTFASVSRNRSEVGDKAVIALLGCDYELLTYTIGLRQLVRRRLPTRRSPSLTPALIYSLIGDTPAILDVTSYPPTSMRMTPKWKEGEGSGMYAVVSILGVMGTACFHGACIV